MPKSADGPGREQASAVAIRRALPEDFARLAELLHEAFAFHGNRPPILTEEMEGALRDHGSGPAPEFEALLAELGQGRRGRVTDGQAIGFALYGPIFWTGDMAPALFLNELYVQPAYRERGIGRAMMAALARVAEQRHWSRIVWMVDHANHPALAFYNQLPGARRLNKFCYSVEGSGLFRLAEEA